MYKRRLYKLQRTTRSKKYATHNRYLTDQEAEEKQAQGYVLTLIEQGTKR